MELVRVESLHVGIPDSFSESRDGGETWLPPSGSSNDGYQATKLSAYTPGLASAQTPSLAWFNGKGVACRQVMSDNGPAYISRRFAKACKVLGLKHIRTRPYTPRTNGKAERFIQTL